MRPESGRRSRARSTADEPLGEYRRKRDFSRTGEPDGDRVQAARQGSLQFVIQKHAASHLHYDLRLELDGVMRSWAVPRGPSLDPSSKRLAMQVEDHPIEYNTFEGTIPKGEYGGGTVMLWDRGTYTPDELRPGEHDADAVRRGLRGGKLSFTFHGERLRGSFALVRTERGEKPKWLLIKHRDATADAATDITTEVVTSVDSGRTMEEIATGSERVWRSNRGSAPGGEERAPARAAADDVIAPMQPTPVKRIPEDDGWLFELWHGGERVLAYVTPDVTRLLAGSTDVTRRYAPIAAQLSALSQRVGRPFVIDGEVVGSGADAVLHVSDLLLDGSSVLLPTPFADRRAALEALFRRRRVKGVRLQTVVPAAPALLAGAARLTAAGVIGRRADAPYTPGERSDALVRLAVR